MARLFATIGSSLDAIDEGSQYLVDRISVLRYDSLYENFNTWFSERRPEWAVPPHLRDEYISFVKAKLKENKE